MNGTEASIYWQSYLDLIELWARGIWDEADFAEHFANHGQEEGRRISDMSSLPDDWSDWLYAANSQDDYVWWWKKGVINSTAYAAMAEGDSAMERGCVSRNAHIQSTAAMSQKALEQVARNGREFPGIGPMSSIATQKMQWAAQKSIGLLPMADAVRELLDEEYGYIIVLPWLESGGGELVGLWHYLAAHELGLNPLIVLGDQPNVTERFKKHGVKTLNLPELYAKITGANYSALVREDRAEILTCALEVLQPEIMHLIHSFTGYTALSARKTKARIRAACKTIYVSAFCPHIHVNGNYDGYFRYIPDIADVVDRFVFDNDWYSREMQVMYQVEKSQIAVLKYPIDEIITKKTAQKLRKKVLWASRFDSQKNPQIVAEIAARMPDTEFVMCGREVLGDTSIDWTKMPENVTQGGEFFNIDELPIRDSFAFLYTSKFDGTPNILLEIGSRGLPIVTPNIGGIAGFLGDDWPLYVNDPDDVDAYVTHLMALKSDQKLSKSLVTKQNRVLKEERRFAAFLEAFGDLVDSTKAS